MDPTIHKWDQEEHPIGPPNAKGRVYLLIKWK